MVAARVLGAAHRTGGVQGARATGARRSGPRYNAERHRGTCVETARQAGRGRGHPQPARPGISLGRSEIPVTSSISRRLILWLAVPLMLLALCGALVHYFNHVAPGVISSDRRLKEATNALMAHLRIKDRRISVDARSDVAPRVPSADSVIYALREPSGRLIDGDGRLPAVPMSGETSQLIAMTQL